ncbi:unnamed protein product [Alopecurus aequalis]
MAHGPDREAPPEWRGTVRAAAAGPTPDQAWALLRDFCSLDKWVPSVQTCRRLEGADGRPGCVRYCAGPVNMAAPGEAVGWSKQSSRKRGTPPTPVLRFRPPYPPYRKHGNFGSKERLVEVDAAGRSYSYEMVETNKGFGRYRATMGVEADPAGCAVTWSFEADPVKGWTLQGFVGFLEKLVRGVAKRLEEEIMHGER